MSTLDLLDPMTEYEVFPDDAWTREGFDDGAENWTDPLGLSDVGVIAESGRRPSPSTWFGHAPGETAPTGHPTPRGGQPGATIEATVASLPIPLVGLVERALAAVAEALAEPPLDEDLWGPGPDHATAVHAAIDTAVADWQATAALRRAATSSDEAATRLGLSPARLHRLAEARTIVAFEHAGEQWFPDWQFDAGVQIDQIGRVWQRFPGDAVWFSEWIHQPQPILGGRTAIDALRDQDVDAVLVAVDALTA